MISLEFCYQPLLILGYGFVVDVVLRLVKHSKISEVLKAHLVNDVEKHFPVRG